ncbi:MULTISPECIES: stage V sporulation protein AC [Thermoanaerobacterium]|uniref:Stage V sporulation protein AC n=1 Tax=Thermoanaerobacterium xylanolyticum (strain ATCC 49914 / DSM 7097 / LX-11) TaxID=858215 RepID=F6BLJ8_THEXL|nr:MULTISPECIES: stage V sporulation protein AC [Thermoanaerobacterium]AEF17245.1 stage V sporulation protein AC [Thermoanaerobacterium xylanolyticum LX-11]MDE4541724.1 stage V sporulation protein AC [Thermoanaerobacterium sp. R66]ORX24133.1 stage V sporulation protein AC [Thermoanaerobacterium sp. PSU-2]HHV73707.1 stage V sporulation protein AC [Thermoanaerobacterium sp.]
MEKDIKKQQEYKDIAQKYEPKPTLLKNVLWAFVVGGLICDVGQFFLNLFINRGMTAEQAGTPVAIIMVFLGSFLTGIGIYDDIGRFAGAGSVVPITGFANSIVSPAMEFKREGFVFGVASRMFNIAGPVIVYGVGTSIIVGLIYYFLKG